MLVRVAALAFLLMAPINLLAIERVSVSTDGTQGNSSSYSPSISSDGRYVAFYSNATNLAPGATNGNWDVFVHDRQTGTTELVSVATDGTKGSGTDPLCSISADGRYVAFYSDATNLVPGDTNLSSDIFVRDRQTGITERVNVATDGTQGNSQSGYPSISADGRYVAFQSEATNLAPGDTNGTWDVFVHDRQIGTTELVSVATDRTEGDERSEQPSISGDGRFVAFLSFTNSDYDVFVLDRQTGIIERVATTGGLVSSAKDPHPSISADGRYVAFGSGATNLVPGDTNGQPDVFVTENPLYVAAPTPSSSPTAIPTSTPGSVSVAAKISAVAGKSTLVCTVKENGRVKKSERVSAEKALVVEGPYQAWKSKTTNAKGQSLFPLPRSKASYYVRCSLVDGTLSQSKKVKRSKQK